MGYSSYRDYRKALAKRKGIESYNEYEKHQAEKRQKRRKNKELSDLIRRRLIELGRNQIWLAEQLGITKGAVSNYVSGRTLPRRILQGRLFHVLELPYETIDDLIKDD